jgi:V8-like Glu-specific endopeptidase
VPAHYRSGASTAQKRPYDYGVITLKTSLGKKLGWWRQLASPSDKILKNAQVNTAGYPGDKGGKYLYWTRNRIVKVHPRRLEYLHDTFGGQSGSPIWLRKGKQRWLIGIHTTRDIDGPPVANTGIRLSAQVLSDIKRWLRL